MAQASQQFTPNQILEAGRRAEAEGRVEYAIQFYRHLTDHLPRTVEAGAAREALTRLGAAPSPIAPMPVAPAPKPVPPAPIDSGSAPAGSLPSPPGAGPGPAPNAARPATAAPQSGPRAVAGAPAAAPTAGTEIVPRRKFVLPKSRRRYRTGRFLARALTVIGFIEMTLGAALLIYGFLGRFNVGAGLLPEFLQGQQQTIGVGGGLTVALIGMLLALAGQLGRAMFDTASANRDLAAFARARAAFEAGVPEPSQHDK